MSSAVTVQDAVEYLSTQTHSARRVGIQNGMPTDFEQSWLQSAAIANCVEGLGKARSTSAKCDALPRWAEKGKVRAPALAVAILRAYFSWCRVKPSEYVDRTGQCEPGCKCGLHGLLLGADRGLVEVHGVLKKWVPGWPNWSKDARNRAATGLADAQIVLSEWVDLWNLRQHLEDTHITVAAFAAKYRVDPRMVTRWCENGKLAAEKIKQARGAPKWWIDVRDIPEPGEQIYSSDIQESEIAEEVGITILTEAESY